MITYVEQITRFVPTVASSMTQASRTSSPISLVHLESRIPAKLLAEIPTSQNLGNSETWPEPAACKHHCRKLTIGMAWEWRT